MILGQFKREIESLMLKKITEKFTGTVTIHISMREGGIGKVELFEKRGLKNGLQKVQRNNNHTS